jgi:hypothetical protein
MATTSRKAFSGAYTTRLALVGALVLIGVLLIASAAQAAVSISRAELSGTQLRIEGQASPNRTITVDGVAMGTSDGAGKFRIERSGFTAPADCTVEVNDGSANPSSARLSGCTVSSPPPPASSVSLSSLTITPSEVVQGASPKGTVTLTEAAPSGGLVVDLTNDYPHIATVPASVTVPAGSRSANFPIVTSPNTTGSAIIIGTVGGVWSTHKYGIITTYSAFHFNNGSISILPGGNGSGRVTSQPAGINCTITLGNGSGTCNAFFPVGTIVRLSASPANNSSLLGWSTNLPGCSDPSRIKVARGTNITCRPIFRLK